VQYVFLWASGVPTSRAAYTLATSLLGATHIGIKPSLESMVEESDSQQHCRDERIVIFFDPVLNF